MTDWAAHDVLVSEDPGLSPRAKRELEQRLIRSLSPGDRETFLSTGMLPARPSGVARVIRDVSGDGRACDGPRFGMEAVRVFDELKRRGGRARRHTVHQSIPGVLQGFVGAGIDDLKSLGLVRESRDWGGGDSVLTLTDGWQDPGLRSTWSRATL